MKTVLYEVKSLNELIIKDVFKCKTKLEITPTQMRIIEYLKENEIVYQKDIEKVLNLSRANTSGVLQTMEKNNLITKVSNKSDARVKQIILSEETKNIFDECKKKFELLEIKLTKDITKEELQIFVDIIEKMKNNLKN